MFGLRTSAIRYYEQIGILPRPMRRNGQRRYDHSALFRVAVVQRARETGFTLEEYASCSSEFPPGTRPPKRWHKLFERKMAELRERMNRLKQWKRCSIASRSVAAMRSTSVARKFCDRDQGKAIAFS